MRAKYKNMLKGLVWRVRQALRSAKNAPTYGMLIKSRSHFRDTQASSLLARLVNKCLTPGGLEYHPLDPERIQSVQAPRVP